MNAPRLGRLARFSFALAALCLASSAAEAHGLHGSHGNTSDAYHYAVAHGLGGLGFAWLAALLLWWPRRAHRSRRQVGM